MWFNPRELQIPQHTPGDSCDFGDFSNYLPLKVAEIAKVAPPSLLKNEEREVILTWLDSIGESNAEIIARVIRRCQEDIAVRNYFLGIAMTLRIASGETDDRHYCHECANLTATGHCLAAQQGKIKSSQDYKPMGDLAFRCEKFINKQDN